MAQTIIQHLQIILIFAVLYHMMGGLNVSDSNDGKPGWLDSLYYSVIVHTTVGFGDILPVTQTGKLLTCIHALYVMRMGLIED